jgi:membrane-associated phospholipid phosphatase
MATRRERPLEGDGKGGFWGEKSNFWNAGFPSGHAINAWALASVVAHEYPRPLIVPVAAYGLATTVCASRFLARKHFASDIVLGAGMGWFIGDYVYAKRHNRELEKVSALERVMAHVHLGGPARPVQLAHADLERSAALAEMPAGN